MIKFKTSTGIDFKLPASLRDVTLQKYIEFLQFVIPTKPKILERLDAAENENDFNEILNEIDAIITAREIHPYYLRVLEFWTGLKYSDLENMNVQNLNWCYNYLMKMFNNMPDPEYSNVFEVDGELWYLPERYMTNSTVIEYAESAQFQQNMKDLAGGDWQAMAKIMCVICRKKDEVYRSTLLRREKMFLGWNLENIYRVAFFLLKRSETLALSFQAFTSAQDLARLKRVLKN